MRGGSRAVSERPGRAPAIIDQHDALLDALQRGDRQAAIDALGARLRDTALALGLAPVEPVSAPGA